MPHKHTLITGGSGLLGSELKKLISGSIAPAHQELDINRERDLMDFCYTHRPQYFIHCAALRQDKGGADPEAILTNIIGTANIALTCTMLDIKLIYISTDYVYPGTQGPYKETDPVLPVNKYAWGKLGGECSVQMMPSDLWLIYRLSFGAENFEHMKAVVDQKTSRVRVGMAARAIACSYTKYTGVFNFGTTKPWTVYDYAVSRGEEVGRIKRAQIGPQIPADTSLDTTKFYETPQSMIGEKGGIYGNNA